MDREPDIVDDSFRAVARQWQDQLRLARDHKKKVFGDSAAEVLQFYSGPRDWSDLMGFHGAGKDDEMPDPLFKMSVNKAYEYVSLFGPALYYESPVRTVKPRLPIEVPPEFFAAVPGMMQVYPSLYQQEFGRVQLDGLRAQLVGAYLNWSPKETDLSAEARDGINEALIKGRGCLWTELYTPPGSNFRLVRSYFDSVSNLLVDPDASSWRQAQWIARRCVHPVWQVERDYGLRPGTLKPNCESQAVQSNDLETDDEYADRRRKGQSNDLLVYYRIWSKMGIGGRLPQVKAQRVGKLLDIFGDYCYMVVADGHDHLLNLPPSMLDREFSGPDELRDQALSWVAWPTPFWATDSWPVSVIDFVKMPNSPWPIPPLKPALGELRFLNWAMSFLTGHIRNSARDFIAVFKGLPDDLKSQIVSGRDLEILEIDAAYAGKGLDELIKFLQHPQMNPDIWTVVEAVANSFDKRVGLTELMYGTSGVQIRSAEEASLKQQNMSVRPEDMAKQVEGWMTEVAAKEAMAARYHLAQQDVTPVLGQLGAYAWTLYVSTRDPQVAARQLEYQIESGSMQRPNKNYEQKQMTEAVQVLGPIFQGYMQMTGDPSPLNSLLSDFAKSRDLDPARYQLAAQPPPQPLPTDEGGTGADQQVPTDNPNPTG